MNFDINSHEILPVFSTSQTGEAKRMTRFVTPLIAAVREKSVPLVTQVLAHPRFDPAQSQIDRALFEAIHMTDFPIFQALFNLTEGNVNIYNPYNESLFVYCCLRGTVPMLQTILAAPSFRPSSREILKAAAAVVRSDHATFIPILRTLAHVDWNCQFPPGINGDRIARSPRKRSNSRQLFHGDVELFPNIAAGITPLIAALRYHRNDVLAALLQEPNIDKSCRGEYGQTILWELSNGNRDLYHLMDQLSGVDINAQDIYGNTAVMFAVITNQRDLLRMLVRRGADLEIENENGETVWAIAHRTRGIEPPPQPTDRDQFLRRILTVMRSSSILSSFS
jgi:hypothetical protein